MNYNEFVDAVMDGVKSRVDGVNVERREIEKLNSRYDGIVVRNNGEKSGYSYDLGDLWNKYKGDNFDRVLDDFLGIVKSFAKKKNEYECLFDYEYAKNRLMMQMVSVNRNKELLADMPHRVIGDIAVIYRVDLGDSTCEIKNDLMKEYGIDEGILYSDAMECQRRDCPPVLRNMAEVMRGFGVHSIESPLWVGMMNRDMFGAACVVFPDFLEKVSEKLGGNMWVLPSSTHEVIFVLDNGVYDKDGLADMVRVINGSEVAEQDFLSDSVYYYDCENEVLRVA